MNASALSASLSLPQTGQRETFVHATLSPSDWSEREREREKERLRK